MSEPLSPKPLAPQAGTFGPSVHTFGHRRADEWDIPFTNWTILRATDADGRSHLFEVPTATLDRERATRPTVEQVAAALHAIRVCDNWSPGYGRLVDGEYEDPHGPAEHKEAAALHARLYADAQSAPSIDVEDAIRWIDPSRTGSGRGCRGDQPSRTTGSAGRRRSEDEHLTRADLERIRWDLGIPIDWTFRARRFGDRWKLTATGGDPMRCGHRSMEVTARTLLLAVAAMARRIRFHRTESWG